MWVPNIETVAYIKIPDLLDRRLYRIWARNLRLGVYNAEKAEFWGLRTKFDRTFVESEYHWDCPSPHATTKPFELLDEPVPADLRLTYSLGSVCETCNTPCTYRKFPEGPRQVSFPDGVTLKVHSVQGEWSHLAPTECARASPTTTPNEPLEKWLYEVHAKYPGDPPDSWQR